MEEEPEERRHKIPKAFEHSPMHKNLRLPESATTPNVQGKNLQRLRTISITDQTQVTASMSKAN